MTERFIYGNEQLKTEIKDGNKEIVKQLKQSIEYRAKHKKFIDEFLYAIRKYFLDKYHFCVNVITGITWFAVEKNLHYYYGGDNIKDCDFKWTAKVLYEFCKEFQCEFKHTSCDGDRYVFTFNDVDTSNAFIIG